MPSNVASKNVSWLHFSWTTLYCKLCIVPNCFTVV